MIRPVHVQPDASCRPCFGLVFCPLVMAGLACAVTGAFTAMIGVPVIGLVCGLSDSGTAECMGIRLRASP